MNTEGGHEGRPYAGWAALSRVANRRYTFTNRATGKSPTYFPRFRAPFFLCSTSPRDSISTNCATFAARRPPP